MADYIQVNMSTDFISSILCPGDISSRNILLESNSFLPGVTEERLCRSFDQISMRCNSFTVDTSSMPQAFYAYDVKIFRLVTKDGADQFISTINEGAAEKKDFALKGDISENLDIVKTLFSSDPTLNRTSGILHRISWGCFYNLKRLTLCLCRWLSDWNGLRWEEVVIHHTFSLPKCASYRRKCVGGINCNSRLPLQKPALERCFIANVERSDSTFSRRYVITYIIFILTFISLVVF